MTDTFTASVAESFQNWAPAGSDFANYNAALSAMFEQVFGIVWDQGSPDDPNFIAGWSSLLDPDVCPTEFLPWLGMLIGIYVTPGTDDATARAQIKTEQGFVRGNPGAILGAARRNLVGTQSAVLQERTAANGSADPYHFVLVVRPEELLWNLVPDPSFEHDTVGSAPPGGAWSVALSGAGSISVNQVQAGWAVSGARSWRLTATSVPTSQYVYADSAQQAAFVGGPYSIEATFNMLSGATPILYVFFYDASHTFISSAASSGTAGPGVQTLQVLNATAPAGTAYVSVHLQLFNASGSTATVDAYVDRVQLVESSVLPGFVDGDTGGFGWSGSAGNSTTTAVGALTAAVDGVKPAGVFWTLIQSDAPLVSQYTRLFSAVTVSLASAILSDVT